MPMSDTARMTDPQAIRNFIFGGKALFTLRSASSGQHFTYKVSEGSKRNPNDANETPVYFVKVLTGPNNTADYQYLGTIFGRQNFTVTAKSAFKKTSPCAIAFEFSLRTILSGKIPATLEFWHEGQCAKCGLTLTDPESIATGFGPICAKTRVVLPTGVVVDGTKTSPTNTLRDTFKSRLSSKTMNSLNDAVYFGQPTAGMGRYERIKAFRDHNDDASDGKFLALAQEAGISIADLEWFAKQEAKTSGVPLDGAALRAEAEHTHEPDFAAVEAAVAEFKKNSPDQFYQDGELNESEALAVATVKFKHLLSKEKS